MQLFDNEPHLPNYIAFYMSRSEIGISDGGVLTVCTHPHNFHHYGPAAEDILSISQLKFSPTCPTS